MKNEIMVSVLCLAYNHEKYIQRTINSILCQNTNFAYEIIIHDDASTDKTKDIIKKYEKKFPGKVIGIYQTINQYSQGKAIIEEYMLPVAQGKYIAFCECDDWWISSNKLQMQFDYMEKNPRCSLCAHNTVLHYVTEEVKDANFNAWRRVHKINSREAFLEWKIHTSSFFMRKEEGYRPEYSRKYWFGDYVRLTTAFTHGAIMVLPFVMSQYNYGVLSGALHDADHVEIEKRKEKVLDRKRYLQQLDMKTNGKYKKIIRERMYLTDLEAATLVEKESLKNAKECKAAAKTILHSEEFRNYIKHTNIVIGIKKIIKLKIYYGILMSRRMLKTGLNKN